MPTWWIAHNTLTAAAFALVVLLACRFTRIGPAARHGLWLVVLIKLITPPIVAWPFAVDLSSTTTIVTALVDGTRDAFRTQDSDATIPRQNTQSVEIAMSGPHSGTAPSPSHVLSTELVQVEAAETDGAPAPSASNAPVTNTRSSSRAEPSGIDRLTMASLSIIVPFAWLLGTLLLLALQTLRIVRLERRVRRGTSAPQWLRNELAEQARQLAVKPPPVVLVPQLVSPALWGCGKTRLLWPEHLAADESPQRWCGVLVHELAHYRRGDHWVARLELLAGLLWWWNPLFWYVRHQIRENAELACDAWVVRTLPDARRSYADALLIVCQGPPDPVLPLPALGIGGSPRRNFERRLTMILRDRVPNRIPLLAVPLLMLLLLAAVPGWSQSQDAAQSPPVHQRIGDRLWAVEPGSDKSAPASDSDIGFVPQTGSTGNANPAVPAQVGPQQETQVQTHPSDRTAAPLNFVGSSQVLNTLTGNVFKAPSAVRNQYSELIEHRRKLEKNVQWMQDQLRDLQASEERLRKRQESLERRYLIPGFRNEIHLAPSKSLQATNERKPAESTYLPPQPEEGDRVLKNTATAPRDEDAFSGTPSNAPLANRKELSDLLEKRRKLEKNVQSMQQELKILEEQLKNSEANTQSFYFSIQGDGEPVRPVAVRIPAVAPAQSAPPKHLVTSNTLTLVRNVYAVPADKTAGLMKFLGDNFEVDVTVGETFREGSFPGEEFKPVEITAPAGVQAVVNDVIELMHRTPAPATKTNRTLTPVPRSAVPTYQ